MSVEVAITPEMLDAAACRDLWRRKFHPAGACCPDCRVCLTDRQAETWRDGGKVVCHGCGKWFTWRTGTPLAGRCGDERHLVIIAGLSLFDLHPAQIAEVCGLHPDTVRTWQRELQRSGILIRRPDRA